MRRNSLTLIVSGALATTLGLTACGQAGQGGSEGDEAAGGDGGATTVTMWTHSAGNPAELEVYERIISEFNASQDQYEVVQEAFPQGAYNDAVVAAAAAGDLPCLIDMDGPIVPNWAWAGYLQPLDLPTEITDALLPSAVGEYQGEIYSAGYWDAALSVFARQSVLEANDIRIPTVQDPWTIEEFTSALETLKAAGYETPLDIGAEDTGEWWPYAYSPFLQSAGGDLIDRDSMLTADGALNSEGSVAAMTWFQEAFENGLTSANGTIGNQEFNDDAVALSYTGVWNAMDSLEAVGEDLLILPRPTSGTGRRSVAAPGSGVSAPTAPLQTARGPTWSSPSPTSTSPSSPTTRWSSPQRPRRPRPRSCSAPTVTCGRSWNCPRTSRSFVRRHRPIP
ncbi:ABC transporter substrate-binding protein [Serinibacter salmoneus]|uniref:ABC transporter substrate-binding protein n=1 Tax=Serinibacter salmoneus TaxID=556530 RepID=UPI001FECD459|nr:extracellular solute-binding protein [Serinibacter salmoneus]